MTLHTRNPCSPHNVSRCDDHKLRILPTITGD